MSERDSEYVDDEELENQQLPSSEDDDHDDDAQGHEDDDDDSEASEDSGDEDSENSGAETLGEGADEDEREAIRERRRQERKNRKVAAREREETLRRELAARDSVINDLRTKVEGIERRNSGSELAQLEQAKRQIGQSYAYFKDQIRLATEAGNGAVVADATEKMLQAQQRFNELQNYERAYRQRQATPQPLDPRLVNYATAWMAKNKWYDPSGKDQDSRIALTLDQQMADEGWEPTTEQYWNELSDRVKKYLPHRAVDDRMNLRRPKSVVQGTKREATSSRSTGYKLSAERVQALKEAGLWDNPEQRSEAIKRFREFDKQNQG